MKTQRYKAKRESGVYAFSFSQRAITVIFTTGAVYKYTYASAGKIKIKTMKRLALYGAGLQAYINKKVRMNYAERMA